MEESTQKVRFSWRRVFTVVVIFLLLYLPFLWFFQPPPREQARRAKCLINLKQIGMAISQYAGDNMDNFTFCDDGIEPYQAFGKLHPKYLSALKIFRCPSARDAKWDPTAAHLDNKDNSPFNKNSCRESLSYAYSHNQEKPWTKKAYFSTRIAADKYSNEDYSSGDNAKKPGNHQTDGRNIVHLDGSAKWNNSKKALDVDPEWDFAAASHIYTTGYKSLINSNPALDQTGADWWSDPPEK